MHRIFTAVAFLAALWSHPVEARQSTTTVSGWTQDVAVARVLERFAGDLQAAVEADGVGGMTAAAFEGSEVFWAMGFGWADTQRRIPADTATIYRIGSITKTMTAVVAVQLAGRGSVDLDQPVETYLPEFANMDGATHIVRSITLRNLASHTGGLIREPRLDDAAAGPLDRWESKILASIPTTALRSAPGEEYHYSNIGFGILGLAVSRAAGRPYMTLVDEWIFQPLGMTNSTFAILPEQRRHLAVGYANGRDGVVDVELPAREHAGRGYKVPNGGVYTTVGDLARFAAGLSGDTPAAILSPAQRRELRTVHTPGDSVPGYGLGVSVRASDDGIRLVGHGGSVAGYNAYLVFNPDTRVGTVILRNYNRGQTNLGQAASTLLVDLVRLRQ